MAMAQLHRASGPIRHGVLTKRDVSKQRLSCSLRNIHYGGEGGGIQKGPTLVAALCAAE